MATPEPILLDVTRDSICSPSERTRYRGSMKKLARALVAVGSVVSALVACSSDPEGSVADAGLPEASTSDATLPEDVPDTSVPEDVPDAALPEDVPDVAVPDANVPDLNVPDVAVPDAGMDASLVDAADGALGCGATAARLCALGERCGANADCAAPNVCTLGVCAPLCPPGTFITGSTCPACPRGRYSEVAGSSSCTACPDNSSTAAVGSTSAAACVPCAVGQVSSSATNYQCTSFDGRVTSGSVAGPVVHATNGGWTGTASLSGGYYVVTGRKTGATLSISWSSAGAIVQGSQVAGLVRVNSTTGVYTWSEATGSRPTVIINSWDPVTRAVRLTASGALMRTNGAPLPNASFSATFSGTLP